MLQLQMVIPSLQTNASFTATLKRYQDLVMDVETAFNFPKTSCRQRTSLTIGKCQPLTPSSSRTVNTIMLFNYMLFGCVIFLLQDDDKLELEIKSDLNSDLWNLIPNVEDHHRHLQQLLDHVLDQRVAMTDMKYRHIVSKLIVVILSNFIQQL